MTWDFHEALDETIKEKYASLYERVVEISNVIHRRTIRGDSWIMTELPEPRKKYRSIDDPWEAS